MESAKDEIVVITVRCIDMTSPRDDSDKIKCDTCGEMTWVSHSWRGKNIDKIICESCFYNSEEFKEDKFKANVTSKSLQEYTDWARQYYSISSCITDEERKRDILRRFERKIGKKVKIIESIR